MTISVRSATGLSGFSLCVGYSLRQFIMFVAMIDYGSIAKILVNQYRKIAIEVEGLIVTKNIQAESAPAI